MTSKLAFKIAVSQMVTHPGNVRKNLAKVLADIEAAKRDGAKLIVFPELATSGYLLGDRWEQDNFIDEIERANEKIREASDNIVIVWGSVRADHDRIGEDGRLRKYNAALIAHGGVFVSNGELCGWIPKTNLPKYRIFDDARHFYPAAKLAAEKGKTLADILRPFVVIIDNEKYSIALTVCEDLWEDEYNTKPGKLYAEHHPDLVIDLSQSPWTAEKWRARDMMLRKRVADVGAPILYVNSVGLQNNGRNLVWFDGNSTLINAQGKFLWHAPRHEECLSTLWPLELEHAPMEQSRPEVIEEIHETLIHAVRTFHGPLGKAIIGLSGGIDSAVMAALLAEAIGKENVIAVNMPTENNSKTTQDLARRCAENLGIEYRVVPIQGLYDETLRLMREQGLDVTKPAVFENVQARIRGHILASIAASVGGVFTCNGNKTELALNYFTLYGDGAGAAAFLGDLWKGQVYDLARRINRLAGTDIIPQGIIDIVPSAELSAAQNVDEGKGDPIFYPYHDNLLRMFVERRWDPEMVLRHAINGTLMEYIPCSDETMRGFFPTKQSFVANLEWCWRQYHIEFKRVQTPPVFITSRRAFGFDRRDTIADGYFSEVYYRLKDQFLVAA